MTNDLKESQFIPYLRLNGVLLTVMFLLHVFWFFVFFKILGRYCKKGKIDDLGNKMEKLE